MAEVGQYQQTSFSNPQNGQNPDADVVRANDNNVATKHNSHDADKTIHVQTGTLASRPAAGTAYAMWMDENGYIYRDDGAAWSEVGYIRPDTVVTGGIEFSGDVQGGTVTAVTQFIGPGTGLTGVPAGQLTGTLPAIPGANLTSLNGSNISSGNIAYARIANGVASANVSATALASATSVQATEMVGVTGGGAVNIAMQNGTGTGAFITIPSGLTDLVTTTTPTGTTANWLKVKVGGVDYRIALQAAT